MSLVLQGQVGRGEFSREVDVTVQHGEILAIVGANGSGKSTVLQTIAGIAALKSGRLSFNNVVWDEPNTKIFTPAQDRHCGVVFQDLRLFPHLSLIANVAYGLRATGLSKQEAHARAAQELTLVGLDDLVDRKPGQVSGGERQRAALARSTAEHSGCAGRRCGGRNRTDGYYAAGAGPARSQRIDRRFRRRCRHTAAGCARTSCTAADADSGAVRRKCGRAQRPRCAARAASACAARAAGRAAAASARGSSRRSRGRRRCDWSGWGHPWHAFSTTEHHQDAGNAVLSVPAFRSSPGH